MQLTMKTFPALLSAAGLATASYVYQEPLQPFSATPSSVDEIPLIGFGTWNLKTNCSKAVSYAIQTGYRHIDCAAIYGNEVEVGIGIADGLAKTGLTRKDIWVTSKLWNDHHGVEEVGEALNTTLTKLGLTYLDLYHMHWPVADSAMGGRKISYRETWAAMTLAQASGRTRHVGVSNFSPKQLEDLLNHTTIKPAVHQMEIHPYLQQNDFLDYHRKHNIHVTAYSPLGGTNPTYTPGDPVQLLNSTVIKKIAHKRDCTPAQVVLSWGVRHGTSVIPKSSHPERVKENFYSYTCELKKKDLKKIDDLYETRHRYNNPSKGWGLQLYEDLEDSKGKHKKHS